MKKADLDRLKRIVGTWDAAAEQIKAKNITPEQLMEDEFSQWALTTPLYNIGEQVYRLSPALKEKYPELPWSMVSGMRHRLVHDYEGINWSVIVEVIFREMPGFVEQVRKICERADEGIVG